MDLEKQITPLFNQIVGLIESSKKKVAVSINSELVRLYWEIGRTINVVVLKEKRADYGKKIIVKLSQKLTYRYGKGWSEKQIRHCLRIAETFSKEEILYAVSRQLSFTHLRTIVYESNELKRSFYLEMTAANSWSTRTLSDQIDKMLYERTAIAQKPEVQIKQELEKLKNSDLVSPDLIFKSSYVLDFLGLKDSYSEKDLEQALISNLQAFILKLGSGFAFIERQKRITVDSVDYHLDLLFYHRKLKCLVAIDLKLGKFKPHYKSQIELYLKWLQQNEMQEGEEAPIGLLLCSKGNTEHIELLLLDENKIKVAQYLTELPSKEWFADKLHRSLEIVRMKQEELK